METFKPYQNIIEKALNQNQIRKGASDSLNESRSIGLSAPAITSRYSLSEFSSSKSHLNLSTDLKAAAKHMGAVPFENQLIGHHPDFSHLKGTNSTEKHYIVSAFIDIKGSTNLYKKYDEETIMIITNTIQLAAIHVCQAFGGFIQRIQGDGLFVYFGGKSVDKKMATQHGLAALSLFTYFVKNDLKRIFEEHGIDKIYTRIGIDFGDDQQVLWAMAGKENTSEISTVSLYTSLASKMQGWAKSNEIVAGKNVKERAGLDEGLFSVVTEKRYIHEDPENGLYYTQYVFDWYKFLRGLSFVASSVNGEISVKPEVQVIPSIAALHTVASVNKPYAS
jgi:adenylate cyclase